MAKLRLRGVIWHARARWVKNGKEKEFNTSLRTSNKSIAYIRLEEVNKVIDDIKAGMEFHFPWQTDSGLTKIKRFTVQDAANQWIARREGIWRKKTIETNQNGLNHFLDFIGSKCPVESIKTTQIEQFTDWMYKKGLCRTSINIHLRTIKAMFRYYLKIDKLNKIPIIEQLSIPKTEPIYITDDEFQSIMELDWLNDFYKRVFLLYRETGMRLNEPMISRLEGNWVDIPNVSKGKAPRSIELEESLKSTFLGLKDWYDNGYGSKLKTPDDHLSKMFKKALRSIGVDEKKHFHSLRHTFAVRRLIQGESIFQLRLMMGHSSVTTTEGYANMNMKRVKQDFPTLVSAYVNDGKNIKRDRKTRDIVGLPTRYVS